jgi:Tfp pilus assembly protein PilV
MTDRSSVTRRGFSTIEVLVALFLLGIALQGVLAVSLASARGAARADSQRRVAARAATIADSLGTLGCRGSAGAQGGRDGTVAWTARHLTTGATYDVVVSPAHGSPWRLEVAASC